MKYSIIIPTRHSRPELLEKLLETINEFTPQEHEVIVVDTPESGYNQKLNEGVAKSKGEYLVFLHDDNEVTEKWLDQSAELGAFLIGELDDSFPTHGGFYRPTERYALDEAPQYTAFFMVSRKALEKIGEFDEAYKEPGFQDVDFGMSAEKAGFGFVPLKGKVIHRHSNVHRATLNEGNKTYLHEKWEL
jgi:glycosyltransferase involved in cell wall biosynthesis